MAVTISGFFVAQRTILHRLGLDAAYPRLVARPQITFTLLGLTFGHLLLMLIYLFANFGNIKAANQAFPPFCSAQLAVGKLITMLLKRDKFVQLIRKFWQLNYKITKEDRRILADEIRKDVRFSNWYYRFLTSSSLWLLGSALVGSILSALRTGQFQGTPIIASYFIDERTPFNYALIFLLCSVTTYTSCHNISTVDTIFSWCMHNNLAQFRILGKQLKRLSESVGGNPSAALLSTWIKNHNYAIDMAAEVRAAFSPIIFQEFAIISTTLCSLVFQISRCDETIGEALYHIAFILTILSQLFLYCYLGQRLQNESSSLTNGVYLGTQWHNVHPAKQKMCMLSMMRTQKPCSISGIFFTVNLALYTWVFQTTGSYITLMWSLDDKN